MKKLWHRFKNFATHRFLFTAVFLLVGISITTGLLLTTWAFYTRQKLEAYKAELVAKGERLTFGASFSPATSEAAQTSQLIVELARRLPPDRIRVFPARYVLPGKAKASASQPSIENPGEQKQSWSDFSKEMEESEELLARARELLRREKVGVFHDVDEDMTPIIGNYASIKNLSVRFSSASLNKLHKGQLSEAGEDLQAGLRLPEVFTEDHLLISELIRIVCASIGYGPVWEALQFDGWSEEQLAGIQQRCAGLEFCTTMIASLEGERAYILKQLARSRSSFTACRVSFEGVGRTSKAGALSLSDISFDSFRDFFGSLIDVTRSVAGRVALPARVALWRWVYCYEDELYFLQNYQQLLEIIRRGTQERNWNWAHERLKALEKRLNAKLGEDDSLRLHFSQQTIRQFFGPFDKAVRTQVQREITITAVALARYKLRHGSYPETLKELTPEWLPAAPHDWFDGTPLKYRRMADGSYLLYSSGQDGHDDGGDGMVIQARTWLVGRDMVWPRPATQEEVGFGVE